MPINVKGKVKLTCENCGRVHTVYGKWFDMEVLDTDVERGMGPVVHYGTEYVYGCDCQKTYGLIIEAWEYPKGVLNGDPEYEPKGVKLEGKFKISIDAE